MKKIITALLIISAMVLTLAMGIGAASDFSVDVTGSSVVKRGEVYEYKIAVNNVSYDGGLMGFDILVKYDPAFFSVDSVSGSVPADWNPDSNKSTAGELWLYPCEADGNAENAVTGSGKIVYTVKLRVVASATLTSSVIKVESALGNTPDFESTENATLGQLEVVLQKKLPTPTGLSLTNGVATWDAVDNATGYAIQLYKNGSKLGSEIKTTATSHDFKSLIASNLGGAYTFTVKATSTNEAFTESAVSEASDPYNYRGKLATPSITVTINSITRELEYFITDSNPDEEVGSYVLRIYKKGSTEVLYEHTGITTAGKVHISQSLESGKEYGFTIIALPANNSPDVGNEASDESAPVYATADYISGISITKAPLLEYVEGETLNLSALVVTVKYSSGAETPVSLKDFEKYGISVTPANGADLTLSMDGRKLVVTLGSMSAPEEYALVVESGECKHDGETEAEHKDATCGEDGYDKTVCKLCGVAIESTVIPATGNHQFNDWTWLFEPTQSIDGIRIHKCQICGREETENVTYEDYMASQTTPGTSDTDPVVTTPDNSGSGEITTETPINDPLGGLGNIGKIFLIILVIIFAVIVLFIVLAIWGESRGRRRRRSNKRAGSSAKRPPQNRGNGQNRPGR